ncbi:hypothetical protein HRbin30_02854 [bacterium HR30]|nr:hypothetical protein HRbin30_02854 [bacterium HR30]
MLPRAGREARRKTPVGEHDTRVGAFCGPGRPRSQAGRCCSIAGAMPAFWRAPAMLVRAGREARRKRPAGEHGTPIGAFC